MSDVQILSGDNQYIRGEYVQPEDDVPEHKNKFLIIMVHGFPGHKDAHDHVFRDLGELINKKGYATLRFDFRGCGESCDHEQGFTLQSAAQDLRTIVEWAKDREHTRLLFVGEGLGAALCMSHVPEEAAGYVFLWPMLDLPALVERIEGAGKALVEGMKNTDMTALLKDFKKPLMIMHGERDEISPVSQLDLVRAHSHARRLEITTFHDGTHGLPALNHRKTMFYHILQFIEKYT